MFYTVFQNTSDFNILEKLMFMTDFYVDNGEVYGYTQHHDFSMKNLKRI